MNEDQVRVIVRDVLAEDKARDSLAVLRGVVAERERFGHIGVVLAGTLPRSLEDFDAILVEVLARPDTSWLNVVERVRRELAQGVAA